MASESIQTLRGDVDAAILGLMLPHEHLFVDLRGPLAPGYAQADPQQVVTVMKPYLDAIEALGITAIVDCAPPGVGRNVAALAALAESTPIHIIAPTGVYKEGFIPSSLLHLTTEALADIWVRELDHGMDDTHIRAGFIKVALSDHGPTEIEVRNLNAAALASRQTGAVVASHTIGADAARRELDILQQAGHPLERFIWVHAHTAPDTALHIEAARRGAWIEFDAVGADAWCPQDMLLDLVVAAVNAGLAQHMLLSHDAGWYDPSRPEGTPPDGVRGYTALFDTFIPAMRARGVSEADITQITTVNPARAYALKQRG